ncbi:MAG: hypothetical protein AAGD14_10505 [Planctomycetota bacterium]
MRVWLLLLCLVACNTEPASEPEPADPPTASSAPSEAKTPDPEPERPQPNWPAVELPGAWKAWKHPHDWDAFVITLDHQGGIFCGERTEDPLSLDELASACRMATKDLKKDPDYPLDILLRIDRRAPWRHMQLVMTILAEQKLYRIWLAITTRKNAGTPSTGRVHRVRSFLPREIPLAGPGPQAEQMFGAPTSIVLRDGGPVFQYGDRKTSNEKELAGWIQEEFDYAVEDGIRPRQLYGEVKAVATMPAGTVVAVQSMYRRAGFPEVRYYGTRLPMRAERIAKPLAAPK